MGPTGWEDLGYVDAMTQGENRHLFIEQKSHFTLNHTKSHTMVMRNEILSRCCETSFQTLLKPPARCALPTGLPQLQHPDVSHSSDAQSASPAFYSPSAKLVLRDSENHRKYKICPRRAKLGYVQTNKGRITIVIPITAGLTKAAEVRGIPWLFSHTMKKTLEKHSITRMNPRTWGRDRKHTLEWTEMLGQSTKLNNPSCLGSKTGEVDDQVWDRECYGKCQGIK